MKMLIAQRFLYAFGLSLCIAGWCGVAGAQDKQDQVTVNDLERTFVVHLPKGYDAQKRYPVVLVLPSRQQDASDMERLSRFNDLADREGVIAVYPNATQEGWNIGVSPEPQKVEPPRMGPGGGRHGGMGGGMGRRGGGYPGGGYPGGGYPGGDSGGYPGGGQGGDQGGGQERHRPSTPQADDLAFFNSMLDKLSSSYAVDATRIYATGLSDGGFMDFRLGCRMADRLAAIAPVGAEMPKAMTCVPPRLLPVLMINGTSDPIVPYRGRSGKPGSYNIISAEDSAKTWASLNNCQVKAQHSTLPPRAKGGKKTDVETYNCTPAAPVVLYSVQDAGNTWPGGEQYMSEKEIGKTSTDIDANEVIWKFFAGHSLPAPPKPATPPQS